jgi:cell wall-associated NlpC family hydrolase
VTLHARRPSRSRLKRGHRSPLRAVLTSLAATVGGFVLALGVTGGAQAAPTPAEVEAQIDQQWNTLEPILEQYNASDSDLAANQAKAAVLAQQIRPLQLRVDVAFSRVSSISAQYYMTGRPSTFTAMLSTNSPTAFAEQLTTLNAMAKKEQLQIKDVIDLKAKYDAEKQPLDALVAKLATQKADLAAKKAGIDAEIKRLDDLRLAAYGTSGGTGNLKPVACPQAYTGGAGAKAAQAACNQIGKSYVFNTAGPRTFDCSGLTEWAWAQAGVTTLRHYTQWQYQDTKRVSQANLRPGDLVFFYSDMHHMAMYVGNNWYVHAPHTGDVVRMAQFGTMPISGYGRPG